MIGLIFIYGYNIVSAIMRGMGDSKRPFMFVAIASVINIILDLLFVAVFHMEVIGAALATVIGQAVSFIFTNIKKGLVSIFVWKVLFRTKKLCKDCVSLVFQWQFSQQQLQFL